MCEKMKLFGRESQFRIKLQDESSVEFYAKLLLNSYKIIRNTPEGEQKLPETRQLSQMLKSVSQVEKFCPSPFPKFVPPQ